MLAVLLGGEAGLLFKDLVKVGVIPVTHQPRYLLHLQPHVAQQLLGALDAHPGEQVDKPLAGLALDEGCLLYTSTPR